LANHEGRLQGIRTALQTMPATRRLAQNAPRRAKINLQPLAVSYVGNRYSGALSVGDQANEVLGCSDRVLHEMDRSGTSSPDHLTQDSEFRMEEHCVPFWCAQAFSIR